MKIRQIILEYDRQRTADRLGAKILQAARANGSFYRILVKQLEKDVGAQPDDNQIILAILSILEGEDPTANKQYTQWLANEYAKRTFRAEDSARVRNALSEFIKYRTAIKRLGKSVDINQYDFYTLQDLIDEITKEGSVAGIRKNYEYENEMRFLSRTVAGELVIPLTQRASCELGQGTRWCTAASKNNMFAHYNEEGPLFIWIDRDGSKYQFWFSSDLRDADEYSDEYWQLMDSSDRPLWEYAPDKLKEFVYQNPVTGKLFRNFESKLLEIPYDNIRREVGMQYAKEVLMKPWPDSVTKEHPELLPLDKYISTMSSSEAFEFLTDYLSTRGVRYNEEDWDNKSVVLDTWDIESAKHLFSYSPIELLTELVHMPASAKLVERAARWLSDMGDDPEKIITEKMPTVAEFIKTLPEDILNRLNSLKKKNQSLEEFIASSPKWEKIVATAILTGSAAGIQDNAVDMLMETILSVKHEHGIGKFRFYDTADPFEMTLTYEITAEDLGKLFRFFDEDESDMSDSLIQNRHDVFFSNKLIFKEPEFSRLFKFDQSRAHQIIRDLMKEKPTRNKS
jgi:hypothetical protein